MFMVRKVNVANMSILNLYIIIYAISFIIQADIVQKLISFPWNFYINENIRIILNILNRMCIIRENVSDFKT